MERLHALSAPLLFVTALVAQRTTSYAVPFEWDDHGITTEASHMLDEVCLALRQGDVDRIEIVGHTDVRGSHQYNDQLSQRRAATVREHLQTGCAAGMAVHTNWTGKRQPRSPGSDEQAHAMDRRVEVVLYHVEAGVSGIEGSPSPYPSHLHRHAQVTPLMPWLDPVREHHVVDAGAPIRFTAQDGVTVSITAMAMRDAQGRVVTGAVDITYRSFHEPYAIVASGIPMHVQDGEEVGHFETAGMFELYASQQGAPVHLASGERIKLDLPAGDRLPDDFTGWRLDEATGTWEAGGELGRSGPAAREEDLGITPTAATMAYWRELIELRRIVVPDSTSFAERRASSRYCYLRRCNEQFDEKKHSRKRKLATKKSTPVAWVVGHKGIYNPDRNVFEVRTNNSKGFPEWRRVPVRAVWEYTSPESRRMFKRMYGRKHVYEDIDLVLSPGTNHGILRLKEQGEWLELPVSAAWNRTTPALTKRWDRAMVAYRKVLRKTELEHDRAVQRDLARYYRLYGTDPQKKAWEHAHKWMDDEEKGLDLEAWLPYADERPLPVFEQRWTLANDVLASVSTTFGLEGFGVYNIDLIMKMADRRELIVDVRDADGRPFPWVVGHAVLDRQKAVVTYWGSGLGRADGMLVAPGRTRSLFLTDAEGRTCRVDPSPLDTRRPGTVVLTAVPLGEPATIEELRAERRP